MKIKEKIWEQSLRQTVDIEAMQFGFMPGRGTTDAIFVLRQLIEKYNEGAKELYMIFVDLEKAFDRVPRSLIEWALRRKGVPERLVAAIMVMYNQAETVVQIEGEVSDSFMVKVGVHQGSILSPLLFNIVLDEIAKVVDKEQLMELLYADDLVLIGRTQDEVKEKFSKWKEALEQKRLKVNLSKTRS